MKTISNRNQFAELLNELGLVGEVAFIGCAEAQFEFWFMDRWKGQKASFIDPWRILDAPGFSGHGEDSDAGQEARYQRIIRNASKYNGRVKVIRATSEEAAQRFGNASLDFVYLDAQHDYPSIKRDIELWAPKIKRGGIFAGHDHVPDGIHNGQSYGVQKAVAEFCSKSNLRVNVTSEPDWPSWWVRREP